MGRNAYIYDAVKAITRSAADGSGNTPDEVSIADITVPAGNDPLVLPRIANVNDKPAYGADGWELSDGGDGNYYLIKAGEFIAYIVSPNLPLSETGWVVTLGETEEFGGNSTLLVTGDPVDPGFVGRLARIGDSSPYTWERWDGTAWVAA